jgi:hypothetical protein
MKERFRTTNFETLVKFNCLHVYQFIESMFIYRVSTLPEQ